MSASERESKPSRPSKPRQQQSAQPVNLSMRDLLASCAAASAVSTPPREKPLAEEQEPETRRDAA
jgi:hypothetical protein